MQGDEGPGISRHEKPKSPASNLRKLGLARPRGDRFSTVSLFRGKDEKEQRERVKLWPKNFSEPHKSMSCNYPPVKKIDSPTKFSYFIFFPPRSLLSEWYVKSMVERWWINNARERERERERGSRASGYQQRLHNLIVDSWKEVQIRHTCVKRSTHRVWNVRNVFHIFDSLR